MVKRRTLEQRINRRANHAMSMSPNPDIFNRAMTRIVAQETRKENLLNAPRLVKRKP